MKLLRKALKFGAVKHQGQIRKVSKLPYITHPIEVSYLASTYKSSKNLEELMCAAVLHDTLEDTDTNFIELSTQFTPMIASLVLELTSDKKQIKEVGKLEYLKTKLLGISNYGLFLKLCDRLSNITDNPTDKSLVETRELLNHLKQNRKLTKSQILVLKEIESCL